MPIGTRLKKTVVIAKHEMELKDLIFKYNPGAHGFLPGNGVESLLKEFIEVNKTSKVRANFTNRRRLKVKLKEDE